MKRTLFERITSLALAVVIAVGQVASVPSYAEGIADLAEQAITQTVEEPGEAPAAAPEQEQEPAAEAPAEENTPPAAQEAPAAQETPAEQEPPAAPEAPAEQEQQEEVVEVASRPRFGSAGVPVEGDILVTGGSWPLSYKYNNQPELTVQGGTGPVWYYVVKDGNVNTPSNGMPTLPGAYWLGVLYTNSKSESVYKQPSAAYTLTITPDTIAAPSGLVWENGTAKWTAPAADSGKAVDDGAIPDYTVCLYHNGNLVETVSDASAAGVDFTGFINDRGYDKYGDYTFTVQANIVSESPARYSSAAVSAESAAYSVTESNAPTISSFAAHSEQGKLTAAFADTESGMQAVAISTGDQPADDSSAWETVDKKATEYTFTVEAAGNYTLYAKDMRGNVSSSGSTVNVKAVTYETGYTNGTADVGTKYLAEGQSFTLPASISRAGYNFAGWNAADTTVTYADAPTELIKAVWTEIPVTVAIAGGDTHAAEYSDSLTLHANVTPLIAGASYTYEWKKEGSDAVLSTDADYTISSAVLGDSGNYTVSVTLQLSGESDRTLGSATTTVTISPKTLTAANVSAILAQTYTGSPIEPTLSFVDGTTLLTLTKGTDYTVTFGNNTAPGTATADITFIGNYQGDPQVTFTIGRRTLTAANVSAIEPHVYDGTAYTPALHFVEDDGTTPLALTKDDYEVVFANNTNVGEGTATVTFKGNYASADPIVLHFNITQRPFPGDAALTMATSDGKEGVRLEGDTYRWKYCGTEKTFNSSVDEAIYGAPTVQYYEGTDATGSPSSEQPPLNAGTYTVAYTYADTTNTAGGTLTRTFTIEKRQITLTSNSGHWDYDGNPHSDPIYTQDGDGFAPGDSFHSVVVNTTITEVTAEPVPNTITYRLSSTTTPGNYLINGVDLTSRENTISTRVKIDENSYTGAGTLEIVAAALPAPANVVWNSGVPGQAKWLTVSKPGANVRYQITLKRVVGDVETPIDLPDSKAEVAGAFCNLADEIRADAESNPTAKYTFTVTAVDNNEKYSDSTAASPAGYQYTATITVKGKNSGIGGLTVGGADVPVTGGSAVRLPGETLRVAATKASGYQLADTVWEKTTPAAPVTFADATAAATTLTLGELTASGEYTVLACAEDDEPVITAFTGTTNAAKNGATLTFTATDTTGITHYRITTTPTKPAADAAGWVELSEADPTNVTVTNIRNNGDDFGKGTYYLWVKDAGDNVVGYTESAPSHGIAPTYTSVNVYQVQFAPGGATGGTAPVDYAYVASQGTPIKLPANRYTKDGTAFKNWQATDDDDNNKVVGTYADTATLTVNSNVTLTAQWAANQYDYTVEYFYMGTDGTYDAAEACPEDNTEIYNKVDSFKADYNAAVPYTEEGIQAGRPGFTLDAAKSVGIEHVTEEKQAVKLYYARRRYNITYRYTYADDPLGTVHTHTPTKGTYYFEEPVTGEAPLTEDGYTFVGWVYGKSGRQPTTMPNESITATGVLYPNDSQYTVQYYTESLDNPGEYVEANSYTVGSVSGFDLPLDENTAQIPDGFSFAGIALENAGGVEVIAKTDAATTKVQNGMTVKVYLNRNTYTVTYRIWKDGREDANLLWSSRDAGGEVISAVNTLTWDYKFGAAVDAAALENSFNAATMLTDPTVVKDYKLTAAEWTCGEKPATMPAGDVVINRDYIPLESYRYQVMVYLQEAESGNYPADPMILHMLGNENQTIEITDDPGSSTADIVLPLSTAFKAIANIDCYDFDASHPGTQLTGTVASPNDSVTLEVYFKLKTYPLTVIYKVDDGAGSVRTIATLHGENQFRWGQYYNVYPLALFNGINSTQLDAWADKYGFTVESAPGVDGTNYRLNEYAVTFTFNYYHQDGRYYDSGRISYQTVNDVVRTDFEEGDENEVYTKKVYTRKCSTNGPTEGKVMNVFTVTYYKNPEEGPKPYMLNINVRYGGDGGLRANPIAGFDEDSTTGTQPLTYNDGAGNTYKVRVANKSHIFNTVDGDPVLPYYLAAVQYADGTDAKITGYTTPKEHWVEKTDPDIGKYYIYDEDGDGVADDGYLYIPDEKERLYNDRYGNYSYNGHFNYKQVTDYLKDYQDEIESSKALQAQDPEYLAARVINWSYYSKPACTGAGPYAEDLTIYFRYDLTAEVTYSLNGSNYTDTYPRGVHTVHHEVLERSITDSTPGYTVNWYKESTFDTLLTGETVPLKDAKYTFWGQVEKVTLPQPDVFDLDADPVGFKYAYYQLPDGKSYLTEKELKTADKVKNHDGTVTYTLTDGTVVTATTTLYPNGETYTNGAGKTVTVDYYCTEYTLADGTIVMRRFTYPALALSPVSMNKDDARYQIDGFRFDETSVENSLSGFTTAESLVNLRAYFARIPYTLTVVPSNSDVINPAEVYTYRFGQTITLETPKYEGYEFSGWELTGGANETVTGPKDADGNVSFAMPNGNTTATALWTPLPNVLTVYHLFQSTDQTYHKDIIDAIREQTGTDVSMTGFDGTNPKVYTVNGKTYASAQKGGMTWYFENAELKGGTVTVQDTGLLGATEDAVSLTTGETYTVGVNEANILALPNPGLGKYYTYRFSAYRDTKQHIDKMVPKGKAQPGDVTEFKAAFGAQMEHYYTRQTNIVLDFKAGSSSMRAYATDGQEAGVTLTGSGTYYYGAKVVISAQLDPGYDFVGWYEYLDKDAKPSKFEDTTKFKKLSESATYSITLNGDTTLLAVVSPKPLGTPEQIEGIKAALAISGKDSYTYGYINGENLVANTTLPANVDPAIVINTFQWYQVTGTSATTQAPTTDSSILTGADYTALAGQKNSTYTFPTGMGVGKTYYTCEYTLIRKDNGRAFTVIAAPYPVEVTAASINVKATGYTGTYDGYPHGIGLNVTRLDGTPMTEGEGSDEYKVYYSTTQLDENNYTTGSTTRPVYTNVNVDGDGNTIDYPVYYYIKPNDSSLQAAYGSAAVRINPQMLTLENTTPYSRVYNGAATVEGDDLAALTNQNPGSGPVYLTVNGYVSSDLSGTENFKLELNAVFKDGSDAETPNVNAQKLELSNILLYNSDDTRNYNYTFGGTTYQFTGSITPVELSLVWSNTGLVYNGRKQNPTAKLSEISRDALGTTVADAIDKNILANLEIAGQTNAGSYTATAVLTKFTVNEKLMEPANYRLTTATAKQTYTIAKREITVGFADGATVEYDGHTHTLTDLQSIKVLKNHDGSAIDVAIGGTITGTGDTFKAARADNSGKNAGTYSTGVTGIRIFNNRGENATENYEIAQKKADLKITQKPVTVSGITVADKAYDGTIAVADTQFGTGSVTFAGIVDGDTLTIGSIYGTYDGAAVGDHTVRLTYTLGGASAENYSIQTPDSQTTAPSAIIGCKIHVDIAAANVVYGNDDITWNVSYRDEWPAGDSAHDTLASASVQVRPKGSTDDGAWAAYTPGMAVGTYKTRIADLTASGSNYTFVPGDYGTLTVTQRPLTITATSNEVTKEYDANTNVAGTDAVPAAGINWTVDNVYSTDDVALNYANARFDHKDVAGAEKATKITLTGLSLTGETKDNYSIVDVGGNLITTLDIPASITPRPVTLKPEAKTTTYGSDAPAFTFTLSSGSMAGSEDESLFEPVTYSCAYSTTDSTNRHAGTYRITIDKFNDNSNYAVEKSTDDVYLTVNKKELTVKPAANYNMAYHGTVPTFGYTIEGFVDAYGDSGSTVEETTSHKMLENLGSIPLVYTVTRGTTFSTDTAQSGYTTAMQAATKGAYTVTPVVTGLEAANYTFKAGPSTLTIATQELTITGGITLQPRVYDGTTNIDKSQYILGGATLTSLVDSAAVAADWAAAIAADGAVTITATYNDGNAGENNRTATIATIALNGYLAERYTLVTTGNQSSITGATITRRPITVQPKYKTKAYDGDPLVPDGYYVQYTDDSSKPALGENDSITAVAYTPASTITEFGTQPSQVQSVTIGGKEYLAATMDGNYDVTYTEVTSSKDANGVGYLEITTATLPAPATVQWKNDAPGTITWSPVTKIGAVPLAGYELVLKKTGDATALETISHTDLDHLTHDFSDTIRANGSGNYYVQVRAVASDESNAGYKNVAQYGTPKDNSAAALAASQVTVEFATDNDDTAVTAGAATAVLAGDKSNTTETFVLLKGETVDLALNGLRQYANYNANTTAFAPNTTGYRLNSFKVNTGAETAIGSPSNGITVTMPDGSLENYNGTLTFDGTDATADDRTVTVSMAAVPATVKVTAATHNTGINPDAYVKYGYPEGERPTIALTVGPESGDTLYTPYETDKTVYSYAYRWYMSESPTDFFTSEDETQTTAIYKFPLGKNAAKNLYRVKYVVKATRSDNGKEITYTNVELVPSGLFAPVFIDIWQATFTANTVFVETATDRGSNHVPTEAAKTANRVSGNVTWEYGEPRKVPAVTNNPGSGKVTYYYSTTEITDVIPNTTMLTNVGEYYAAAQIDATTNYEKWFTGHDCNAKYKITPATLGAVTNLKMVASPTAPYGLIQWDAVDGIKESGGASEVKVRYLVKLYKVDADTDTAPNWASDTPVHEEITKNPYLDVTAHMTSATAHYWYSVQAVGYDNNTDTRTVDGTHNANDGAVVTSAQSIQVTRKATVVDTTPTPGRTGTTYNGYPYKISIPVKSGDSGYQWWFKGSDTLRQVDTTTDHAVTVIDSDYATLYVMDVANTGTYFCRLTNGGQPVESTAVSVTITPQPITIMSASASRPYDGTVLKAESFVAEVSAGEKGTIALGNGDSINVTGWNAGQTVKGTLTNTYTLDAQEIIHAVTANTTAHDVTANYTITKKTGTLKVTAKSLADDVGGTITVTNSIEPRTYNGAAQTGMESELTVKYKPTGADEITLALGTDYTVEYENNRNAATASDANAPTVVIKAKDTDKFSGSVEAKFTIQPYPITFESVGNIGLVYTGAARSNQQVKVYTTGHREDDTQPFSITVTKSDPEQTPAAHTLFSTDTVTFSGFNTVTTVADGLQNNTFSYNIDDGTGGKNYTVTPVTDAKIQIVAKNLGADLALDSAIKIKDIPDKTYNGKRFEPTDSEVEVTYTVGGTPKTLEQGTDYTISYPHTGDTTDLTNRNAGTGKVIITGTGNYSGKVVKEFAINRATLTFTSHTQSWEYDGSAHTDKQVDISDAVTVKNVDASVTNSTALMEGDSVCFTFDGGSTVTNVADSSKSNRFTAHITDAKDSVNSVDVPNNADGVYGNYNIKVTPGTLKITTRSLGLSDGKTINSEGGITIDDFADKTYNGTEQKQTVVVKYNGTVLTPASGGSDNDYSVAYTDCRNAGTVTVTITGHGNYSGKFEKTYEIAPYPISLTSLGATDTYNGTALTNHTAPTAGFVKGTDFAIMDETATSVLLSDSDEAHKDTMQVTVYGTQTNAGTSKNHFTLTITDTVDGSKSATIDTADAGTVDGAKFGNYIISGTPDIGTLTVNKRALTVKSATDSQTYNHNALTNHKVTISGVDGGDKPLTNEGSDTTATLCIDADTLQASVTGSQTVQGSSSNTFGTVTLHTNDTNYSVDANATDPVDCGNYTVKLVPGTLTVGKKALNDGTAVAAGVTATVANTVYSGEEQKQPVTISYNGMSLVKDTDFTVTYPADCTNADIKTVTVAAKPESTKYSGSFQLTYEITPFEIDVEAQNKEVTYNGSSHQLEDIVVTAHNSGETLPTGHTFTAVSWSETEKTAQGTYTGIKATTVQVNGGAIAITNYSIVNNTPGTLTIGSNTFVDDPAKFTFTGFSDTLYSGAVQEQLPTVKDVSLNKTLTKDVDYTVGYSSDTTNAGTVTVTITGINNYTGDITKTYRILPRSVKLISAGDSKVYDGTPLTNDTVTVDPACDGFWDGEGYTPTVTGTQTDAGSSANVFSYDLTGGALPGNYTITKEEGTLQVDKADLTVKAKGYTGVEDGRKHSITVTATAVNDQPITIYYSTKPIAVDISDADLADAIADGTIKTDAITYKNASTHRVYYLVTAPNHNPVAGSAVVQIDHPSSPTPTPDPEPTPTPVPPVPPVPVPTPKPRPRPTPTPKPTEGGLPGDEPDGNPDGTPGSNPGGDPTGNPTGGENPDGLPMIRDEIVTLEKGSPEKRGEFGYGKGKIVVVVRTGNDSAATLNASVHSKQITDLLVTEEELAMVADGGLIEIELSVLEVKAQTSAEMGIPPQDEALMEELVEECQPAIPGLTIGTYLDISLRKRVNGGPWEPIPEADDDLDIEIEIPETLHAKDNVYYVGRIHNLEKALLRDVDDKPVTLTIQTRYFSTYAILLVPAECFWHWATVIATLLGALLAYIANRRRKKWAPVFGAVAIVLNIVFCVLGFCHLDLPIAVVCSLLSLLVIWRARVNEDEEEQAESAKA